MPLKIELKPHEKIIVGEALITNDSERTRLYIEGNAPILREKFIMREAEANTPCKKVYYVVLQMYLSKTPINLHNTYFKLIGEVQSAAPSLMPIILKINDSIQSGEYYNAIKHSDELISKEKEIFEKVGIVNP
ncbi:MAG: flagellar biosynthesis repressor FlbT [Alphaproteobacteria bacterium]